MKRFSVFLIIVVLFIPLVVYGVYGLVNNNFLNLNNIPEKPIIKPLDEPTPPDSDNPSKLPNPFIQAMPKGILGKVVNIDPTSKVIRLIDAKYFNPITQKNETSDLFIVYLNDKTKFIKDLEFNAKFSDISEGSEIICQGATNFEKYEMKYATLIFFGRLLPANFQTIIPCGGAIEELDRVNKTFVLDLSLIYEGLAKVKVHITESTVCYTEKENTENSIKEIGKGIIPEFVENGSMVDVEIRLKEGETDAYAERAYFVEP